MGKLHELLAVEGDLEGTYKKIVEEATTTFAKKPDHFIGFTKILSMFDAASPENGMTEHKDLVSTIDEKLEYVSDHVVRYFDAVLQKELTNQTAKADLVVDGVVIGKDLPATFLLGLETRLKNIRMMYESIPTYAPGVHWEPSDDERKGSFRTKYPDEKMKTAKTFMHKVLYDATDKHPAQIEKWEEQKPVGKYTTTTICGMYSPAQKSAILGRIDKLIQATKKARQKANTSEIIDATIGTSILNFVNGK